MAQVVECDERRRFFIGRVRKLADARVRRLEEGATGAENLNELPVDLEPHGTRGHVSEYGAEMDVKSRSLARRKIDLLYIDYATRQVRGQEIRSLDLCHAEY